VFFTRGVATREGIFTAQFSFTKHSYQFVLENAKECYGFTLPSNRETVDFLQKHANNLDEIARRLVIDKKTQSLIIRGYEHLSNPTLRPKLQMYTSESTLTQSLSHL
jgi:hypothetical protein